MRLNVYRRLESGGTFSYLAVPVDAVIPGEASNTDWQTEAMDIEVADDADYLDDYAIDQLSGQIAAKGYAMTSIYH